MIHNFLDNKNKVSKTFHANNNNSISSDEVINLALANERGSSTLRQYNISNANSDNSPEILAMQPNEAKGKSENDWYDETAEVALSAKLNIYPKRIGKNIQELTLELRANDQIHYIFITDVLGKIWYENEIDQFQQILKIDTEYLPTGSYNILIENDGLFSAKRFVKTK